MGVDSHECHYREEQGIAAHDLKAQEFREETHFSGGGVEGWKEFDLEKKFKFDGVEGFEAYTRSLEVWILERIVQ